MSKRNTTAAPATSVAPAIASVRDGGVRAFGIARDLATYGADMLVVWPELATDFAEGHAMWANFDAGVIDAFDAKTSSILAVKNDEDATWSVAPAGYVKGEVSDQIITAAWCRSRNRSLWASMQKDQPTLFALAKPVRDSASRAIAEARRVLRDAVRKSMTGASRKTKSGNRTPVEVITDSVKELQDLVKSYETRKTLTAEQVKTLRDWIKAMPKI